VPLLPVVDWNPAMLVVTSNWCVSDGTLATGPARGLIDRFRDEVRRSSLRLGFRRDGIYRPVEGVDVVLAGDTFDWLVSREWIGETRPWETGSRAAAALERVAAGSRRRSGRLLATLTAWTRRGIEIPLADRRGRPTPGVCRRVPVRVAVLCGGRDRWLDRVVNEAVPPGLVVGRCWSDGDVTVWHGTEFDPLWAADGGEPTLGESLAVDLSSRFGGGLNAVTVLRPLAGGLMRRLAAGRILDAPLQLAAWLAAIDRSDKLSPAARQSLSSIPGTGLLASGTGLPGDCRRRGRGASISWACWPSGWNSRKPPLVDGRGIRCRPGYRSAMRCSVMRPRPLFSDIPQPI